MRQGNQIDLRSRSGSRTVAVAPSESAQFIINAQQSRIGAGGGSAGLYNYVRGIMLKCVISVTRAVVGSGSFTPIWADRFPMAIKSINLNTPMDGTIWDPTIMSGMVAKHLFDYVLNGYREEALNAQPIPAAAGTYSRTLYLYLPFAQKWNPWPDHFAKWLGWLNDAQFEIFAADAVNAFESTSGTYTDTINSVTMSSQMDMVPWPEIIIPPDVVLRRYEVAANASSNGPTLINVGSAGAIQGVEDGSRLVGMFFSHQAEGFIGSGTANEITSYTAAWRDQNQTLAMDSFFLRWLQTSHMRPPMGFDVSGGTASHGVDTTTPYPNELALAGSLADASARFTPLVWPEVGELVTSFQKVKGNYPLDMVFNTPQDNVFRVFTLELKQRSLSKCSEMIAAFGVDPSTVSLVPKLGRKNTKSIDPDKLWGVPRSVVSAR